MTLGGVLDFEYVRSDLDKVLDKGAGNLRGVHLPALREVIRQRSALQPDSLDPAPIVALLRETIEARFGHSADGPVISEALGLHQGDGSRPKRERLTRAADRMGISRDTFTRAPLKRLLTELAEGLMAAAGQQDLTGTSVTDEPTTRPIRAIGIVGALFASLFGVVGAILLADQPWKALVVAVGCLLVAVAFAIAFLLGRPVRANRSGPILLGVLGIACLAGAVLMPGDEDNGAGHDPTGPSSRPEAKVVTSERQFQLNPNHGLDLDSQRTVTVDSVIPTDGADVDFVLLAGTPHIRGTYVWIPPTNGGLAYTTCRTMSDDALPLFPLSDFNVGDILCVKSNQDRYGAIRIDSLPANDSEPLGLTVSIWRP